jgi:hypothetical protein
MLSVAPRQTIYSLIVLFLVSLTVFVDASVLATQPAYAQGGMAGMFNGANTTIEALTKLQIMSMFSSQTVPAEATAQLQFYKPLIDHLAIANDATKQRIYQTALGKEGSGSLIGFLSNVRQVVFDPKFAESASAEERGSIAQIQNGVADRMIHQAGQATQPSWSGIFTNAIQIGVAMGIVDCMQKIIGESCSRVVNKIPSMFAFVGRIGSKGFNYVCNRPDPLSPDEVLIWEQSFECLINSLCEHSVSGNLMLKNIRVSDDDQAGEIAADVNWLFLSNSIKLMCGHINEFFGERILYYTGCKHQRKALVGISNAFSIENRESIAFVITMIMSNLKQLVEVCERAKSGDEVDRVHIKKLGRITLLLFNKLRVMIGGGSIPGVQASGGAAYQSSGGLIER